MSMDKPIIIRNGIAIYNMGSSPGCIINQWVEVFTWQYTVAKALYFGM